MGRSAGARKTEGSYPTRRPDISTLRPRRQFYLVATILLPNVESPNTIHDALAVLNREIELYPDYVTGRLGRGVADKIAI